MDKFEKYIRDLYRDGELDTESLPEGAEERFLSRLRKEGMAADSPTPPGGRRRTFLPRSIAWAVPAAAIILLGVLFGVRTVHKDRTEDYFAGIGDDPREVYERYLALVGDSYREIYSNPGAEQFAGLDNDLRSLTEESIPMMEQIPDEVGAKRKSDLMKDYYGTILDAVGRIGRSL